MADEHAAALTSGPADRAGPDEVEIRDAELADVPALLEIENAVFITDRLSRRSFRDYVSSPRAILRVALIGGVLAGYHLVLFRQGTAAARLYSLAVGPAWQGHGLGRLLLANAEAAAFDSDRAVLRLEVEVGNEAALALYRSAGYRLVAKLPRYYESGEDGLRLEKPLRGAIPQSSVPYYEQNTEFTCGPCCLMMALAARKPGYRMDPATEVRLWRRATSVFLGGGLGGCDPYGLAVTLAEEGLAPEIHVTESGPLMLQTVRHPDKRKVMELVQEEFRREVAERGIPVHLGWLGISELAEKLQTGALAVLLVSGNRMFGKRVPHWVLAYHADRRHIFIHDPWVEDKAFETATDAASIPAPLAELDRMWRWGTSRLRAAVLIPAEGGTPTK